MKPQDSCAKITVLFELSNYTFRQILINNVTSQEIVLIVKAPPLNTTTTSAP